MLFLTFLVVIVGCYARDPAQNTANPLKDLQKLSPQEFRATVCPDLDRSRGLLKCAPEETEDFYKQANNYINLYGKPNAADLQPIVILPGMGGSALQAKIKKNEAPHWWCWQNWDEWFRDWLPLYELLSQDCWFDNLKVDYNETTNEYNNQPGVTIDVMDFGGLSGIDYLDYWFGWPVPFTTYYSSLIKSLEKVGYESGKTVFGAPYDWRLPSSAHELDEQAFNTRFRTLIESAYESTGKRVHVVTHSMGGPTSLAFFNNRPQEWLDKYIASFIPIAGPWAGSAKALRTSLTGDNFGIEVLGFNLLNIEAVAKLAKQAGGIIELIPHSRFYKQDYVFVKTPEKTYTAKDFVQLYKDADSPISAVIHQQTEKLFEQWAPPRVVTHCLYGFGFKTEIAFHYKDGLKKQPEIDYGNNGDGTVPLESLQECLTWGASQKPAVYVKEFNLDHSAILEDQELFAYILNITTNATGF